MPTILEPPTSSRQAAVDHDHESLSKYHEVIPHPSHPTRKPIAKGQLLIDGQWRDAQDSATMPTSDPTTETVITQVAKATAEDARRGGRGLQCLRGRPVGADAPRGACQDPLRIADLMDERREEFALRKAMDMGMPYRDFITIIMPHCSGLFRFFGGLAMHAMNGG